MMIFKRGVFESRRRNKTVFRPKIRLNLKEVQTVSLRTTSLFSDAACGVLCYSSVSLQPGHQILNPAPYSLHRWQIEERLPNLDTASLHPFRKAFVSLYSPRFVTLKGKRLKKSLGKVQMHRPRSGAPEAFVPDWLVLA